MFECGVHECTDIGTLCRIRPSGIHRTEYVGWPYGRGGCRGLTTPPPPVVTRRPRSALARALLLDRDVHGFRVGSLGGAVVRPSGRPSAPAGGPAGRRATRRREEVTRRGPAGTGSGFGSGSGPGWSAVSSAVSSAARRPAGTRVADDQRLRGDRGRGQRGVVGAVLCTRVGGGPGNRTGRRIGRGLVGVGRPGLVPGHRGDVLGRRRGLRPHRCPCRCRCRCPGRCRCRCRRPSPRLRPRRPRRGSSSCCLRGSTGSCCTSRPRPWQWSQVSLNASSRPVPIRLRVICTSPARSPRRPGGGCGRGPGTRPAGAAPGRGCSRGPCR